MICLTSARIFKKSKILLGLLSFFLMYVRAYATNSSGTSYGNEITLTTSPQLIALGSAPGLSVLSL
jgi:hypothetical protein